MLLFLSATFMVSAQWGSMGIASKVILKSGDFNFLKNEKQLNVEYDYSTLKVGAFNSEQEYIDKRVKELNEKEAGKGDKWKEGWVNARKERFQPKFKELYNDKMGDEKKATIDENAKSAKYTLIVRTTFIEPGYNIGISKKPSFVNFEFEYVETADHTKKLAEAYVNNVIGSQAMGFDYDTGSRVAESYAKGGKMLAIFIIKGK